MQLIALFKKEFILLRKNWIMLFANILVPFLTICISLIYTNSSVININVGYNGKIDYRTVENELNKLKKGVRFNLVSYNNLEYLQKAFENDKVSCYMNIYDDRNINLYYDSDNNKSQLAYQYLIVALRNINYSNYNDKLINEMKNEQIYSVNKINDIKHEKKNGNKMNSIIWSGFLWIFIYTNLSSSITQMQQERNTKTILYLCKAGVNKFYLIISKISAVLVQFIIMVVVFVLLTTKLGLLNYSFNYMQVVYWLLTCICISSIGHLLGIIIKNSSLLIVIQMIVILPVMLLNALQTTVYDRYIEKIPIYSCVNISKSAMLNIQPCVVDIVVCIVTIICCYTLFMVYISKREPLKLCKIQ